MTDTSPTLPAETGSTEITRFNALKHGMLSRYTVLPWEDVDEYRVLVEALSAEHAPQGPTEEHLVEELAGILWRKRRLRKELANRPLIREQAFGEAVDPDKLERLGRYEVHLDRKLERTLAMLLRLKELRPTTVEG
jgi:hypothetical protein